MKAFMPDLYLEQASHLFGLQGRFPVSTQQVIPVQKHLNPLFVSGFNTA